MNEEVRESLHLGVSMHLMAAVVGLAFFLLFVGRSVASDASVYASDLVGDVQVGVMEDLLQDECVMPAAGLYNLLRTYDSTVSEYYCLCEVHGGTRVGPYDLSLGMTPCILLHMTGKVSVQVEMADSWGYKVTVHDPDCDWFNTACSCG